MKGTRLERRIDRAMRETRQLQRARLDAAPPHGEGSACIASGLEQLRAALRPTSIVACAQDLLVTETGFITMAVLPERVERVRDLLVVPGADDAGRCGYLILRSGHPPFHSLESDVRAATDEALLNQHRAAELVAAFGDRDGLRRAARAAPWHLRSVFADTERAGLCRWGSESFLDRYRMRRVAMTAGLPRAALRLAGSYGERVTAATLLRKARVVPALA